MARKLYEFYESIQCKDVEWLWYPYIPYGKITLLQGDPGEGKSTFILNIAALLTRGYPLPEDIAERVPQTVIYQCAEDGIADTIKPRLIAAGADCGKVAYIIDDDQNLTLDDSRIEKVIRETAARMLIIDPIQAFMGQDSDMQSAVKSRNVLRKLSSIAAKNNCAVVLVGHMNKGSGNKSLYRSLGSIDIVAISRSVLMITRDPKIPSMRYMMPIKSSLAAEGPGISFELNPEKGFLWGSVPSKAIAGAGEKQTLSKSAIARQCILDMLSDGPVQSSEIIAHLSRLGVSRRTTVEVKKELGVKAYKAGAAWFWCLPDIDDTSEKGENYK